MSKKFYHGNLAKMDNETKFRLQQKLMNMLALDERIREKLIRSGELFDGYHSEMESVHNSNADQLFAIIEEHGWLSVEKIGKEASEAAWRIVQHAIAKPDFQKKCLTLIKSLPRIGKAELRHMAHLQDRIDVFEGRLQTYGTQFDWDDFGQMSPKPILDCEKVDQLRNQVGLPPLNEALSEIRRRTEKEGGKPPLDSQKHKEIFVQWAKKVGWRK